MRRVLLVILFIGVTCMPLASVQSPECDEGSARRTIEDLWNRSARGELLTAKGWAADAGFFLQPLKPFDNSAIEIMSDYYGVNSVSIKGTGADVQVEFTAMGKIDAQLRYSPPAPQRAHKTSVGYHLVAGPRYMMMYGADGKTLVEKKEVPGETVWRMEGTPPAAPWAMVNSVIRYVLEKRSKTKDPVLKNNADETLAILITLH
jgi:hypothetical protein